MTRAPLYAIIVIMPTAYVPESPELECRCGRLNTRPHCPTCGSYDLYARSRKQDDIVTDQESGERLSLQTFRCKRCGRMFNEQDWRLRCFAQRSSKSETRFAKTTLVKSSALERQQELKKSPHVRKMANAARVRMGLLPLTDAEFDAEESQP